jgi:membrane-associated phospholipid phosphatase
MVMPCPLYIGLAPGNPLKICGPKDQLDYAPSSAHMKLFCLSISAYNECPIYKRKTADRKEVNTRGGNKSFLSINQITPFHGLTLIFLYGLILLTLFFRVQVPLWQSLVFRYVSSIVLLLIIQFIYDRNVMGKVGVFLHYFSSIFFVIFIYTSLGDLIQYLKPDIDPLLIRIDYYLFGVHPTVWIEQWIVPWFTDLMSLAYAGYYFLPVILITTLYLKGREEELKLSLLILVFGYYLSFIGYILFPAIGPRYTLTHLQTIPLEGSPLTDWVRDGLNALEHNKRDVMPSGHTQIALIVLYLAYRYERVIFYLFLPTVSGLILSTIYLRYHYVVDLFAGCALAIGCIVFGPPLFKWWNRFSNERQL